jgi:hypothetical protein
VQTLRPLCLFQLLTVSARNVDSLCINFTSVIKI